MLSPKFVNGRAGKYLTFQVARKYFAVETSRVRNVMPQPAIAPFPESMEGVCGYVRMNGRTTAVLDLRAKMGLPPRAANAPRSVIILDFEEFPGAGCIGLMVDRLTEVIDVHERDVKGDVVQLRANGRPYGRPKILLDLSTLLPHSEIEMLKAALANASGI